jgi:glycosyltransferase involved in cell wall biosynthesis
MHGRPLGLMKVELPAGGVAPSALADRIQLELGHEAARHLTDDGLPPGEVRAEGIAGPEVPRCAAGQAQLLASPLTVSVVICTRGRPDSVRRTLRSILACEYPAERLEVIVVDNASHGDAEVRMVSDELSAAVPVRIVREANPGLSNARNRGLQGAGGEIVAFADDDVDVDRRWLAALLVPFCNGENVGATSGMTLPGALETPVQRWTEGFGGRTGPPLVQRFDLASPPPDKPLFPFTVGDLGAGRNMAFRRELLTQLGGFDPALGPGTIARDGDDIEALLRVLLSGHAVVADPAAVVWHAHPHQYGELKDRVWGYGVGLTACLTKATLDHPSLIPDLLRKLPGGVRFALSGDSPKNAGRQPDFPRRLIWLELAGMAYGPFAYARSRRDQRGRGTASTAGAAPGER